MLDFRVMTAFRICFFYFCSFHEVTCITKEGIIFPASGSLQGIAGYYNFSISFTYHSAWKPLVGSDAYQIR